jgi:hypothetical protein
MLTRAAARRPGMASKIAVSAWVRLAIAPRHGTTWVTPDRAHFDWAAPHLEFLDSLPSAMSGAVWLPRLSVTALAGRSVLQSHDYEENEHDQHDDASQRERPDLAPHGPDLPAAGPDAQPGLIGAGGMPDQKPGGNRDENGQGRKPI